MVESERLAIKDSEELEKLFRGEGAEDEIKGGKISPKLTMPLPGDSGIDVRILYIKNKDGTVAGVVDRVKNAKFNNPEGEADFMNVELYQNPGIELRMGLSESLKASLRRMMNDEVPRWKVVELPGKVIHITASYWTNAPANKRGMSVVCRGCGGKGCKVCNNTGIQLHPIVFNCTPRKDLVAPVVTAAAKSDTF